MIKLPRSLLCFYLLTCVRQGLTMCSRQALNPSSSHPNLPRGWDYGRSPPYPVIFENISFKYGRKANIVVHVYNPSTQGWRQQGQEFDASLDALWEAGEGFGDSQKHTFCTNTGPEFRSLTSTQKPGMEAWVYNPRTGKVEETGPSRSSWASQPGQIRDFQVPWESRSQNIKRWEMIEKDINLWLIDTHILTSMNIHQKTETWRSIYWDLGGEHCWYSVLRGSVKEKGPSRMNFRFSQNSRGASSG